MTCSAPVQELKLPPPSRSRVFFTMYRICRSTSRTLRPGLTCVFRRVQLILRIFHKPNKLVGVVKCTDRVVVKWESDDQANEIYNLF